MSAEQDTAMFDQPDGDTRPATRLSRNELLARLGDAERERDALAAVASHVARVRLTDEEQQQIDAYQALASHQFFAFVHGRHGPFLDEMLAALDSATPTVALETVKAEAWDEGANWAVVEIRGDRFSGAQFLAPGDNPYRKTDTKGGE